MEPKKPSKSQVKVLTAFLADPQRELYGFGLIRSTGMKSGALYPVLDRLESDGWIKGRQEDIDEKTEGRPKRHLYRLTALGEREGRRAVAEFYRDLGPIPKWLPGLEGG